MDEPGDRIGDKPAQVRQRNVLAHAGAAKHARLHHSAQWGVGEGRTGWAYAIPTKDHAIRTLPLEQIRPGVERFLDYAREHPELTFEVTAIGTGLAGYKPHQIAPMFAGAPSNCELPEGWRDHG